MPASGSATCPHTAATDATAAPAPDRYRSGAASCILRALVTPVLAEFAIMKPAQQMRVVIQPVGGTQHLIKVTAMIARRGFLFRPLADDTQLFPA